MRWQIDLCTSRSPADVIVACSRPEIRSQHGYATWHQMQPCRCYRVPKFVVSGIVAAVRLLRKLRRFPLTFSLFFWIYRFVRDTCERQYAHSGTRYLQFNMGTLKERQQRGATGDNVTPRRVDFDGDGVALWSEYVHGSRYWPITFLERKQWRMRTGAVEKREKAAKLGALEAEEHECRRALNRNRFATMERQWWYTALQQLWKWVLSSFKWALN